MESKIGENNAVGATGDSEYPIWKIYEMYANQPMPGLKDTKNNNYNTVSEMWQQQLNDD